MVDIFWDSAEKKNWKVYTILETSELLLFHKNWLIIYIFILHIWIKFQKLEAESEDAYLDSQWADSNQLKRQFHGMNNIKWGPR